MMTVVWERQWLFWCERRLSESEQMLTQASSSCCCCCLLHLKSWTFMKSLFMSEFARIATILVVRFPNSWKCEKSMWKIISEMQNCIYAICMEARLKDLGAVKVEFSCFKGIENPTDIHGCWGTWLPSWPLLVKRKQLIVTPSFLFFSPNISFYFCWRLSWQRQDCQISRSPLFPLSDVWKLCLYVHLQQCSDC